MSIKVDQLADTIQKELGLYSDDVNDGVKKAVDEVADQSVKELGQSSPRRTGSYAKNWAKQNTYESRRTKRNTVHNKKRYQLTHLLENGHAKRGGGRVAPRVHIEPVEKKAIETLEKKVKEVAQG